MTTDQVRELQTVLAEANGLIRSFGAVCDRRGTQTNWDALSAEVRRVLAVQHQYLHPEQYTAPRAG